MKKYCYSCMRELDPYSDRCPHCGASNAACAAAQPTYALPCGTVLAGHFLVGRFLGEGGFGITYIGRNTGLNRTVCIKEYYPKGACQRYGKQSRTVSWGTGEIANYHREHCGGMMEEAQKALRLDHLKSVVRVWDVFPENNTAYIVMDYIEGQTLRNYLMENNSLMDEKECIELLLPVLSDLEEMHRDEIIHRDISPDNLMRRSDGKLMLLDLGAAKDLRSSLVQSSFPVVRRGFSPSEQYSVDSKIGPWTDVYAVCAVIAWCVTGGRRLPEPLDRMMGETLDLSGVSPELAAVLEKGLALKPEDRIQTADELRRELENVIEPKHEPRPRRWIWLLGLAALAAAVVFFCVRKSPAPVEEEKVSVSAPTATFTPESVFRYEEVGNGVSITGCDADAVNLTIPATLNGKSVVSIGKNAFKDNGSLTSVTIPDSVTAIGSSAFYGCSSLTSVTIPDGVTTIGHSAFLNCTGLTSVTIPNSVISIGDYTFWNCTGLTSVTIPDSVTSIGEGVFAACSSLPEIQVSERNPAFCSVDDVLFDKSMTTIFQYPTGKGGLSYTIPDSVTTIKSRAFEGCSSLTSVTIPSSVTTIGEHAFQSCTGLTRVTIPEGVTSISKHVFCNCTGLTDVTIPDSVTDIGENVFSGCKALKTIHVKPDSYAANYFAGDSRLVLEGENSDEDVKKLLRYEIVDGGVSITGCDADAVSLTIPATLDGKPVVSIGSEAFRGRSLESVTIPNSVTEIGDFAFTGSSLTSVTIPDSVTSIGISAFCKCNRLESARVSSKEGVIGDGAFQYCDNLKSVEILNGVTGIGNAAFYKCSSLTSVTIPDSVTTIGENAFSGCTALKAIHVQPDSYAANYFPGDSRLVLEAANSGKDAKELLRYEIVGNGVSITGCDAEAVSLTIPATLDGKPVVNIGKNAFYDCSSLKTVIIPKGVTSIGNWAFESCSSLTSVTIPDSVTAIGDRAFKSCSSLTSVTIPDSVTSIGEDLFKDCTALKAIHVKAGSYAAEYFKGDARLVID